MPEVFIIDICYGPGFSVLPTERGEVIVTKPRKARGGFRHS